MNICLKKLYLNLSEISAIYIYEASLADIYMKNSHIIKVRDVATVQELQGWMATHQSSSSLIGSDRTPIPSDGSSIT